MKIKHRVRSSKAKFDQLLIVGDFNLPNVDWATVTASTDCQMYTIFTKAIKDHFLWQLIDFPTRNDNLLDLLLTNIPDKISNIKGFQDILNSDHQLIEFSMDLRIKSQKPHVKRRLYNFKKADWNGLKYSLSLINWDLCFEENNTNASLTNWSDTFLAAVDQQIPTSKPRNINEHPWIDHELLNLIKVKNKLRKAVIKRGSTLDDDRFRQARREAKAMIKMIKVRLKTLVEQYKGYSKKFPNKVSLKYFECISVRKFACCARSSCRIIKRSEVIN